MIRVYASDSLSAPVNTRTDGVSYSWSVAQELGTREDRLFVYTHYNFVHSAKKPTPPVDTARGCAIAFDLMAVPVLRGKRITRVDGPFLYMTDRWLGLGVEGAAAPSRLYDTRRPFMAVYEERPHDAAQRNPIGSARVGSYFDVRAGRGDMIAIDGSGKQISIVVGGIATYPSYIGKRYQGYIDVTCDSHTGPNKPYIEVEYQSSPVEVVNCSPQSGFIDEHVVNRFTWSLVPKGYDTVGGVVQRRAEFNWRIRNAVEVQRIVIEGPNTFVDLPANILPNIEIEWRVKAEETGGQWSAVTPWYLLTTVDAQLNPPDRLAPDGGVRDGSRAIRLSWRHNSPLSTPPSAFDVQADKGDGRGFQALIGKTPSRESACDVPAGKLSSGAVSWRVRDYNSDGAASAYSAAARFTVRAAPDPPVFRSVEQGTPRPLVQWLSAAQQAFELAVLSEESGKEAYRSDSVFGVQTSLRVPVFLADGRYIFRVRVQNAFALWSAWAQTEAVISNPRRMSLDAWGEQVDGGVRIDFEAEVL